MDLPSSTFVACSLADALVATKQSTRTPPRSRTKAGSSDHARGLSGYLVAHQPAKAECPDQYRDEARGEQPGQARWVGLNSSSARTAPARIATIISRATSMSRLSEDQRRSCQVQQAGAPEAKHGADHPRGERGQRPRPEWDDQSRCCEQRRSLGPGQGEPDQPDRPCRRPAEQRFLRPIPSRLESDW